MNIAPAILRIAVKECTLVKVVDLKLSQTCIQTLVLWCNLWDSGGRNGPSIKIIWNAMHGGAGI